MIASMKSSRIHARSWRAALALAALLFLPQAHSQSTGNVVQLDLEGALGVATAEYIIDGIQEAEDRNADLVIIRMDTPGGLVEPMRDIVQKILAAEVPVATYVSPGGARADSAGTYILLASHVAAMAPTSHLGAATPVSLTGGGFGDEDIDSDPRPFLNDRNEDDASEEAATDDAGDESAADDVNEAERNEPPLPGTAMERKVLNDAISYIRSLAEAHGRNADWAEDAVRSAATLTAAEALEENVIDLIAADRSELLAALDGRELIVAGNEMTLQTSGATVEVIEPNWRLKILNTIASPEIAILLLMVGLYGLLFEGYNPGAVIPGVVGVISLLLAAYALQVLPVNYAGLALIILGMGLIVAEAFAPSFGALGLGGIVAMAFGSVMMFDSGIPGFGVSVAFVIGLVLVAGLFLFWMVSFLVKLRKRGAVSGRESIVGSVGRVKESFVGKGHIWLESEVWSAQCATPLDKGQEVRVVTMDGLVLHVEPLTGIATSATSPGDAGVNI